MSLKLYQNISTVIIFSIWLYVAITAIREYRRLMRTNGIGPGISKKEIAKISDPEMLAAMDRWKKMTRRLMLIWFVSAILFMIVSIIIYNTIGFKA